MSGARVLGEVAAERVAQEAKWGEQNHPNGTGPMTTLPGLPFECDEDGDVYVYADEFESWARGRCEWLADTDRCTYAAILLEEVAEALATLDPAQLRRELVQVAAVAVAWVEKIDRDAVNAS